MKTAILGGLVGACVGLVLAGCSPNELIQGLATVGQGSNGDRDVVGSLEVVAQNTQNSLTQLGLNVTRTDKGGAVYLTSASRSGNRFTLVLTQVRSYQGTKTHIHLEWQDAHDDQFGLQLMSHVEKQGTN
jgi:hypothetical protein